MKAEKMTIAQFQRHISDRYEKVDRARGSARTFLWFIEEVGELATALGAQKKRKNKNLQEEFADVLAWLCTLANINGVDLARAVTEKYLGDKEPKGHK